MQGLTNISEQDHHIDPTTTEGLLDLAALGNVLELCWVYDIREYDSAGQEKSGVPQVEVAQRDAIWKKYHNFQKTFSQRKRLKMDGLLVDPMTEFFDLSILHLAVTICKYKAMEPNANGHFSVGQLWRQVRDHISRHHPKLLPVFALEVKKPVEELAYCKTFEWSGPDFVVVDALDYDEGFLMAGSLNDYAVDVSNM